LSIYPEESKSTFSRDTSLLKFISALYTVAKYRISLVSTKRLKGKTHCLYTHTHTHTHIGCYSVLQRNKILSCEGKWIELEIIILSKIIQLHIKHDCMFSLICRIQWK
jgi:hypothetical protein